MILNEQPPPKRMKNTNAPKATVNSEPGSDLLETIKGISGSVGEGLTDDELTRLLREIALPTEAGFAFLSFCGGWVTLTVPQQDLANWYPERGWIVPEKEKTAREIAIKYAFSLCEPPDISSSYRSLRGELPAPHHHLELSNRRETIVVAHPRYLKVRLVGMSQPILNVQAAGTPLALSKELLQDLSALYSA